MRYHLFRRWSVFFLTIVITLSLCVSAGAAFLDQGSIASAYGKAVDYMTGNGVLNGFPDGTFKPEDTLTREQAAKIITYMKLGEKQAEELTDSNSPFEDLPFSYWSTPYVVWCVEQQIILGYGNGKFGPQDQLTGFQFAKMLLVALRLAREGNYVGAGDSWDEYVFEDGEKVGLFDGDSGMATNQPISRQQAALLAFNAMAAAIMNADMNGLEPSNDTGSAPETPEVPVVIPPTGTSDDSEPVPPTEPENPSGNDDISEDPEVGSDAGTGNEDPGETGHEIPGGNDNENPGDTETPSIPGEGEDPAPPENPGEDNKPPRDPSQPIELPDLP